MFCTHDENDSFMSSTLLARTKVRGTVQQRKSYLPWNFTSTFKTMAKRRVEILHFKFHRISWPTQFTEPFSTPLKTLGHLAKNVVV